MTGRGSGQFGSRGSIEARLGALLGPRTNPAKGPRAMLNDTLRRLVERLYFAEFRVAEQTSWVGDREVSQLIAVKGPGLRNDGLACVTRLGSPDGMREGVGPDNSLPRVLWALMTFMSQVDAAANLSARSFERPLFLILATGPTWVAARSVLQLFEEDTIHPAWALVSAPTGGAIAERHPGVVLARLRPSAALLSSYPRGLGGTRVRRIRADSGPDPLGLVTVGLIEQLAQRPGSLHNLRLCQENGANILLSAIVADPEGCVEAPGIAEEVEDGVALGPDLRPFARDLAGGLKSLLRQGLDARLCEITGGPEKPQANIELRYTEPGAPPRICLAVEEAFPAGEDRLDLSMDTALPPLSPSMAPALRAALKDAGLDRTVAASGPTEASAFAGANFETLLLGPGVRRQEGGIQLEAEALDLYARRFRGILRRLLIGESGESADGPRVSR